MTQPLAYLSDNWFRVEGAQNGKTGAYLNAATVRLLSLTGPDGSSVSGITYPASLSYIAGSNGDYELLFERALALARDAVYLAKAEVDAGAGLYLHLEENLVVRLGGRR